MKDRLDEIMNKANLTELIHKKEVEEKHKNSVVFILAIIGAVAAVAGIAFAVYKFLQPDYLDDSDYDDFDDDFDDDYVELNSDDEDKDED